MTRQIILDCETTGLSPAAGHRIIEVGCIELVDRKLTGNDFHAYVNPMRMVEQEAINVHGLTNDFLYGMPRFQQIKPALIKYLIGADEIIAHNASFDIGFLKAEGVSIKCSVIDTLKLARVEFPKKQNSLDALCKRYDIKSGRELHGALLDAELLAYVYLRLTGGQLELIREEKAEEITEFKRISVSGLRVIYASPEELAEHDRLKQLMEA